MAMTLNNALGRLEGVTGSGKQYYARCPAHADEKASLSIGEGEAGKLLLFCQAGCSFPAIVEAIDKLPGKPDGSANTGKRTHGAGCGKPMAAYTYMDEDGNPLYRKNRYADKRFYIEHYNANRGRWAAGRKGCRLVPYNLPAVIAADTVYIVEGEKDVDTLKKMEIAGTCSPDGAGPGKFKMEYARYFHDKTIYIIADNDNAGKTFAQDEARILAPVAKSVKILDLLKICPQLPEHGDISDVINMLGLDAGQTKEALAGLVASTPDYVPSVPASAVGTLCAADVEEKDVAWLWRNVLVQGALNSVQGLAGIGKTFLLCAVSAAVSKGGAVQSVDGHMERLQRGRVLYLSGDDDVSTTIVPRLNELQASLSNIYFASQDILPPIGSVEFEQFFDEVKPSMCIVDTLQHFLPPRTNLNAANETTAALYPLKVLAEKYDCAVVVIQHISKNSASGNGGYSVNFGLGSSAVNGLLRSVWTLGRLKGDNDKPSDTRALAPSKTNLVKGDPPAILFDLSQERGFEWAGINNELTAEQLYTPPKNPPYRPSDKREQVKGEIQKILCDNLPAMRSEELQRLVIARIGCSERTYKTACADLGVIRKKVGDFWYSSLP